MAKLKVTRADGQVGEYPITPLVQYGFEMYAKKGFHKAFIEDQKQSDIFWLAWECIRRSGELNSFTRTADTFPGKPEDVALLLIFDKRFVKALLSVNLKTILHQWSDWVFPN